MMTRKRNDYFTLRGDLIYSGIENSTLVATARNDHTFFVEMLDNRTLVFKKLNVYKKQSQLDIEITLDFSRFQDIRVDSVYAMNPSNRGHFVTADHQKGLIFCFDRQGFLLNQIKAEGNIVQIEKLNNFLVVLTSKEFFYLNINRNYTKTNCVWPEDSLESFTFEVSFRIRMTVLYSPSSPTATGGGELKSPNLLLVPRESVSWRIVALSPSISLISFIGNKYNRTGLLQITSLIQVADTYIYFLNKKESANLY